MQMLLCLSCGNFVTATTEGDAPTPVRDRCPQCAGTRFKDVHTDYTVESSAE